MGLSPSAFSGRRSADPPGRAKPRNQGDRVEGAASPLQSLSAAGREGQAQTAGRHSRGSGALGVRLGHRCPRRREETGDASQAPSSVRTTPFRSKGKKMTPGWSRRQSKGTRKGGSSSAPMRQVLRLTRDPSPRQLPTNHDYDGAPFTGRSANIRVINRRLSRFDYRLLRPGSDPEGVASG